MHVLRPSKNKQTGDPASHGYVAYDFSGRGDDNAYASLFGKVVQSKNSETRTWLANTATDPFKPAKGTRKLRTEDYGNYVKIIHDVDGRKYYTLYAHLEPGTAASVGTEVKQGQIIGKIGNTGNSSSKHLHFELRDEHDKTIEAEFVTDSTPNQPPMETQTKEQIIIDVYKALTDEYPTEETKKWRLQQNKNTVELVRDLLEGDTTAKAYILGKWGINPSVDTTELVAQYEEARTKLREALNIPSSADTETMIATIVALRNKPEATKEVFVHMNEKYEKVYAWNNIWIVVPKKQS